MGGDSGMDGFMCSVEGLTGWIFDRIYEMDKIGVHPIPPAVPGEF
jgi:hypothetical protein